MNRAERRRTNNKRNKLNKKVAKLTPQIAELIEIQAKSKFNDYVERFQTALDLSVSATLVGDLARGQEQVAKLRLEKDIAESSYYTAISAIENLRIEIEILRSKLRWYREEYHHS